MSNLKEDLEYLQLYSICKAYQDKAKEAEEKNLSYTGYLELLIQEEVTDRIQRSIKKRISEAKFPIIKTIDTFNFDWPKSINRKKILQLFEMNFVEEKKNILILQRRIQIRSAMSFLLKQPEMQKSLQEQ